MAFYITTEAGDQFITESGADHIITERSIALYLGFPVFDLFANWAQEMNEALFRQMILLDNITGMGTVRSPTAGPVGGLRFMLQLHGRSEIREFRSWLDLFRGRYTPVWLPTWNADLAPTQNLSGTSVVVESVGYEDNLFPHNARKHIVVISHTRTLYPRGVTAASDNGVTETLTITPTLGTTLVKEHSMVSFLVLARLVEDRLKINWIARDLAEVEMVFVEVPREAPAAT